MKSLQQRVIDYIQEMRLLAPGDRAGVAVSGGADSVALLRILHGARERLGLKLMVAHFDHCLRGEASEADAEFVADLARRYELPFILGREDVAGAARRNKWNLEDAARRLRYAFFERIIREGQVTRVAVAHTADDQAETVLAHMIRGSGPTGLAGIYPVAGAVVRPLLDIRRQELRGYLRSHGETWREDTTNQDVRRLRARIRTRLAPLLERGFSPRALERLAALARLCREEQVFWGALTEERLRALARRTEAGITIRTTDLIAPMNLPDEARQGQSRGSEQNAPLRALTERLIRQLFKELKGSRQGLTARHVEQVIHLATVSGGGRRVDLPGGVVVRKSYGELIFGIENERAAGWQHADEDHGSRAYAYRIELPERGCAVVSVPELQRLFRLKVIDWGCAERETRGGCLALDAARLQMPLILRNWRPGDAYRPLGRRQIHKVKQMFAEGRIPAHDRAGWPVLESAGEVVWARGMSPAGEFCVGKDTTVGVLIEEERL